VRISEEAEELLEILWTQAEEEKEESVTSTSLFDRTDKAVIRELSLNRLIEHSNEEARLTEQGRREAESVVRRHRLAERLLLDVLGVGNELIEEAACKFEHLLHKNIDDKICTLLGHPLYCPHGKSIPKGKCCLEKKERAERIVTSLTSLKPEQGGKIAYIHTRMEERLRKLMAMDVLPGKPITLIQRFPSYVFQVGHTQIAADEEIAKDIYVRLEE
jgi:DtxR family Mn-dependent transcriptional regulator